MAFFTRMGHSVPEFPLAENEQEAAGAAALPIPENPGPSSLLPVIPAVVHQQAMSGRPQLVLHRQPPPPYGIPPLNYGSSLHLESSIDEEDDSAIRHGIDV